MWLGSLVRGFFSLSLRHKGFLSNSAGDRGEKSANPSDKGTEEMKFQFFLVFDTEKGKQKNLKVTEWEPSVCQDVR